MTPSEKSPVAGIGGGSGKLYRRLARNLTYLAGGTGLAAAFNMAALAFNARALSPELFGLLVLLQTSALALKGLISFGTQQPVMQLGAAALAGDDLKRLGHIIGLGLLYDLSAAALASMTAFLLIIAAGEVLSLTSTTSWFAAVFAGAILFTGYLTSNGIFRLFDRFDLIAAMEAGAAGVVLCASALFYFVEADFIAYVVLYAGVMALSIQLQLWTAIRLARKKGVRISFGVAAMRKDDKATFFAYCSSSWGTAALESLRNYGDSLLVAGLVSVEGVGLYNVAKQTAGILRKVTTIYVSALYPEVSNLAAAKDVAASQRLKNRMIILGAAVGAICVLAAALLGHHILEIAFGPRFTAAQGALILLVLAAALQLISHTLATYVQVYISPARIFFIYLASMAVYATAATLGVELMGLSGAAVGQVMFSCAVISFSWWALRGVTKGARTQPE